MKIYRWTAETIKRFEDAEGDLKLLTEVQRRRVLLVLGGNSIAEIAQQERVTPAAVSDSLEAANGWRNRQARKARS